MSEDAVVLALRAALRASDQPAIRLALGQQLLRLDRASEALAELETSLRQDPTNVDVLTLAAQACHGAGDPGRAMAYEIAASALGGAGGSASTAVAPTTAPGPTRATAGNQEGHPLPPESGTWTPQPATPAGEGPRLRLITDDDSGDVEIEEPTLTFADVGGLDDVKKRLDRSFLMPLRKPSLFARFGKKVGGGLLLYGPPGCGKTFLARALAGEIGARLVNIGLADVLDMWLGESERKLHELFETARRQAPVVMFFDEVDALGQRRSQLRGSAGRNIVNQLLTEMDGATGNNEGVFILGATNQPWDLDPAMRRPGRFDRTIFVPPPDLPARLRILELKLADRPVAPRADLKALAKATEGYSGADLQALVDAATEIAIQASLDAGREVHIQQAMLDEGRRDVRASTRPWFESARNYALYANEGGSWDDLLAYLKTVGLA